MNSKTLPLSTSPDCPRPSVAAILGAAVASPVQMKPARPLRVLVVEDDQNEVELLQIKLEKAGYEAACQRVGTPKDFAAALQEQTWDLIIADHDLKLAGFDSLAALRMMKERGLDLPFIIVSGAITDVTAVAAMKAGAHDYMMKDNLTRLGPAIERELRDAETRRQRRLAEEERNRAEAALRRAYDELEMRVQQRTAQLAAANEKLQASILERKRLEQELLEITEKERRRIGLDLHDDLGQKLSGIAMMSKALEHRLAKRGASEAQDASRIHDQVHQAMNHASDLARDLATLDFQENDLPVALGDLADRAKELFSISCRLQVEGAIPPLDPNAVRQLYKIAQEAVTNAIKHAKAKKVVISLTANHEQLGLEIRNDGLPFPDIQGRSSGMGLRIMHYRASLIGGSFEIKATGKHGAQALCIVPLEPEKH